MLFVPLKSMSCLYVPIATMVDKHKGSDVTSNKLMNFWNIKNMRNEIFRKSLTDIDRTQVKSFY